MSTADHILAAAEGLLVRSDDVDAFSARRIADAAGVNASAINYHFGSREEVLLAAVRGIYRRFNSERLRLLQVAIDAKAPEPPDLAEVITALVGPSVRWSLDPNSSYLAFINLRALSSASQSRLGGNSPKRRVEHLTPFVAAFRKIAPQLSDAEIGFRIHAALGVRSFFIRDRTRLLALVGTAFDLNDADEVIAMMVSVIAPMFKA
jgi:AcrR family transcriptional regulator